MENPFVYGEVVPASAFVDRDEELARLASDLAAGQKVFLISPRRYGKSSLIRQAMRRLQRQKVLTVELTVSSYSSYLAFLEGLARALLSLEADAARAPSWFRALFDTAAPEVRYERAPGAARSRLTVAFPATSGRREIDRLAEEVFALPARVADSLGRRLAIALDEFQDIAAYDGGTVEQALRAAVQHQRQVGYVFAGSEPSLMERMIGPKRPFYKAGPVMRLQRIPADLFAAFVSARFTRTGLRPDPDVGTALVELAGNLPYDVQRLAHEVWDDVTTARRRRVTVEDLHGTLHRLLHEQDVLFESAWQRLTLAQRAVLRAVVLAEGRELMAAETRTRYRLGGPSSVQSALAALGRADLVARDATGRYAVVDSLLREWVARKTY
jgi:uncharacterized protein